MARCARPGIVAFIASQATFCSTSSPTIWFASQGSYHFEAQAQNTTRPEGAAFPLSAPALSDSDPTPAPRANIARFSVFPQTASYFPAQNWAEELACTATAGRSKLHSSTMCRNSRDKAEYKPDSLSA